MPTQNRGHRAPEGRPGHSGTATRVRGAARGTAGPLRTRWRLLLTTADRLDTIFKDGPGQGDLLASSGVAAG